MNTLNQNLANYLCNCENYDLNKLLLNINSILETDIKLLIAPVWFPGENDEDIENIIKYVLSLNNKKIMLGIQKYLLYKTGRKLKKIRPKSWGYFYKQLSQLEKKIDLKLKLGPEDFGIHKRKIALNLNLQKNDLIDLKIISKGRWKRECIGKINDDIAIKVLLQKPLISNDVIGKKVKVKVIKANYKDNIITAVFPI